MSSWLRDRLVADRVLAAAFLAPFAPVIAMCAWLVRRHDGAPALITVRRIGRQGRPFQMWKLRTMGADVAGGRAAGAALTGAGDPRITPVGRWLRAYHLDELPQLYNVVRGEMGLLGPRPEAPEFVDPSDPAWATVLRAAPGMAGPTQLVVGDWERDVIAARGSQAYVRDVLPVKLAIDGWYVRRAAPRLDALIALAMLRRAVSEGGAAQLAERVRDEVAEARLVGS